MTEFLREEENKFRVMLLNLAWIMDILGLLIFLLQILKIVVLFKKQNFMLLIRLPTTIEVWI